MKNNFSFFLIAVATLAFSSCMQDHPKESDVNKEVRINASIKSSSTSDRISTRAIDQTWQAGDAIGVFMKKANSTLSNFALAENAKYVADGSLLFQPATEEDKIYFPFNNEKIDFISYYPYQSNLTGLVYEVDVTNQNNLAGIDLLYSNNVTSVSSVDENINLIFTHQLTKVVIDISTNNTSKDLKGLQAKITNVNTKASFSLVDGLLTNANEPSEIAFNVSEDGQKAEAIILPIETMTNEVLVITLGDVSYSYPLTNSVSISSFNKSTKYNFSITLQPGQGPILDQVNATITDWETIREDIVIEEDDATTPPDGGDPPVDPDPDPEIVDGDGTKDNPYNILQVLQNTNTKRNVWIKGYIVGAYTGSKKDTFCNNATDGRQYTLALAFSENETQYENTFPVLLSYDIVNAVNLKTNPTHFSKEIYLYGDVKEWESSSSMGLNEALQAIIDGVIYK